VKLKTGFVKSELSLMHKTNKILTNQNDRYFDREISWLSFNQRVLLQAYDETIPFGERLRYICISSGNLDEFYMVRIAGLLHLIEHEFNIIPDTGMRADELLSTALNELKNLQNQQQQCINNLLDHKKCNFSILNENQLDEGDLRWLKEYYEQNILPLLTPTTLDPAHPFPFIQNKGKCVLLEMQDSQKNEKNCVVLLPDNIERFIRLPGESQCYVMLETLVIKFVNLIYPDFRLIHSGLFRVIRDAEIEIDDEADDLIGQFETAIKARKRGGVVSLTFSKDLSKSAQKLLTRELNIPDDHIYVAKGFVGIDDFAEIINNLPKQNLFKIYKPRMPQRILDFKGDCFSAIKNKDIIVHHPYESFDVVLSLLQQAAIDDNVLAIRQTLYRTSPDSPIVSALVKAAELGKSVIAVIELKARFDEENNVQLARILEKAGAQVAYGLVDLKVHTKMSLITRREGKKLVSYAHCGTGNYHPHTAKIYTDFSFFTIDKKICDDARSVFNFLTSHVQPKNLNKMIISPNSSFDWLINRIDDEIKNAKENLESGIWIKCNAIVDQKIIEKLYEASTAGVKIHLMVRGICCLRPNVKGMSENIKVTAIIGRFLEHGRVYVFANKGKFQSENNLVYISSADMMPRNLYHRVEAFIPLENKTVRSQVLKQVLPALINDTKNSWQLNENGEYLKMTNKDKSFCAHTYFMNNPSLSGQGSLAKI
tara:strand:+ start:1731 stop:3860 length:2130 start_codon:yes stop_codon:yes gene_type:complete